MILVLLGALVLAQCVSLAIYLADRRGFMIDMVEELLASRLPAVVRALDDLPADGQGDFMAALESRWSRYRIGTEPIATASDDSIARELASELDLPSGDARVRLVDPDRAVLINDSSRLEHAGAVLQVAVPLGPGRWLNVERLAYPDWWHLAGRMAISLALSALAVLAVAAFLARRITRPLAQLADSADRLGRGEEVARLPASGPEDVVRTVRAFNRMNARLTRFVEDRTRMLAAISHDLRTPITALRIRAEMVDDDDTRVRIIGSLDEMESMVEGTLRFARAEAQSEDSETVDLGDLVRHAAVDVAPEGSGRVVFAAVQGGVRCRCRPTMLGRALRNILDNAVRYGSRARVTVRRAGEGGIVEIEDDGPGIRPEDRETVFEPFMRLEVSRSTDTGGHGLGLAIARTIVRAHGGDIELENRTSGGLRVRVQLP